MQTNKQTDNLFFFIWPSLQSREHLKSLLKKLFLWYSFSWTFVINWTAGPYEVMQTSSERSTLYGLSRPHIKKKFFSKSFTKKRVGGGVLWMLFIWSWWKEAISFSLHLQVQQTLCIYGMLSSFSETATTGESFAFIKFLSTSENESGWKLKTTLYESTTDKQRVICFSTESHHSLWRGFYPEPYF